MASSHTSSPKPESSRHSAATSTTFTPEMRDRQARGKDPYHSDSEDSDWAPGQGDRGGDGSRTGSSRGNVGPARTGTRKRDAEPFAAVDRRRMAAQILNSPELLMMAALRDDESVAATRLKYTRMLCGMDEPTRPGIPHTAPTETQRKRPNQDQGQGTFTW
ncbi:hypothetical protein F5B22DRAFT_122321 [Xylaria bambusicola]|uniref:uncharacterized protein n=1 Tax=Xylaria bambusicola TaxID=326684 RepID=UPI002007C707|nr:uncharacterized protein F5B22DRAFT_122321 [Xylaria bambusicola]KAI0517378.1 hypothetical protein F5B22DRAFT_122321 [Xylaria bambusicola]